MPYEVREFIKRAAWDTLHDDRASADQQEVAKRTIAFAWWARAMSKGIPSNHFEAFMAAHLAYIDATLSRNREQIAAAEKAIAPWLEFG